MPDEKKDAVKVAPKPKVVAGRGKDGLPLSGIDKTRYQYRFEVNRPEFVQGAIEGSHTQGVKFQVVNATNHPGIHPSDFKNNVIYRNEVQQDSILLFAPVPPQPSRVRTKKDKA